MCHVYLVGAGGHGLTCLGPTMKGVCQRPALWHSHHRGAGTASSGLLQLWCLMEPDKAVHA